MNTLPSWAKVEQDGSVLQIHSGSQPPNEAGVTFVSIDDHPIESGKEISHWTGQQWVYRPEKPSEFHIWDFASRTWINPRTLPVLKLIKWEEIKALRELAIEAPFATPFGTFDGDSKARKDITDTIMLMQNAESFGMGPQTTDFTLADNSVAVGLTTAQMVQVGLLMGAKVKAAYDRGRVLREQIDAAQTKEELSAITW